jgi:DNA-binding response OmpR family regulator
MRTRLVKPLSVLVTGAGLLMAMPSAASAAPLSTSQITITRGAEDASKIQISWAPVEGAARYNVSVFDGTHDEVKVVKAPTNTLSLVRSESCVRLRVNIGSRDASGAGATSKNVWLNTLAPGGISGLKGERTGDFTQMVAAWKEPAWLGYGAPGGYRVQLIRAGDRAVVYEGLVPATTARFTGLDPAREYTLQVAAENSFGSCVIAKQTIGTSKPTAPTAFKAVRDPATPAQVNVSWAPPAYGGYGAASYYEIGYGVDKVTSWTKVDGTSATLKLDSGTTWTIQVRAVNQFGTGGAAGLKLVAAEAVGSSTTRPGITVTPDGSKIQVKLDSKIGSFLQYPNLVLRVSPTVADGGFTDEQWGANGASTMTFGELPNGLYTLQVNGSGTAGEVEWSRQIVNIGNVGVVANTQWLTVSSGGNGNNADFSAVTNTGRKSTNQALMTSVTLKDGQGYGVWSRASIDTNKKLSGYLVEFDPNYSNIVKGYGPAMVLRMQDKGKQCSAPLATTKMSSALAAAGTHRVAVVTNGDSLYATVDDVVVLNVASLAKAATAVSCKSTAPTGTEAGVRLLNNVALTAYSTTTLNLIPPPEKRRVVADLPKWLVGHHPALFDAQEPRPAADRHAYPVGPLPGGQPVSRPRALLVEDSPEFVLLCKHLLEKEGFEVLVAGDGNRAVELASRERLELAVLDLGLPDLDGVEVCRRIRQYTDAYVVMVTGRTDEVDKIVGLSVGADDYVTKPFSPRELAARIQAMRRRPRGGPESADPAVREFGLIRIDPVVREVTLDGAQVELTKIEFDLLDLLSSSPRRTFTRNQLLEAVWGENWFGDDHIIDVHMGNLRRKLGESASAPRHIRTVRGVGYRFEP